MSDCEFGWSIEREGDVLKIPLLLFADDIVLLARSKEGLQKMLDIAGDVMTEIRLSFNEKKSGVLVFKGDSALTGFNVQGRSLPLVHEYKYLGIVLSSDFDYTRSDAGLRLNLAKKGRGLVRMKSLWAFSRYIMARNLWKALVVPGITYGNAVITSNPVFETKLEQMQREVIRFSLGCRFTCAKEFLEGESGMSTFRERETQSKLLYWLRLNQMDLSRWAGKLHQFKVEHRIKTRWDRRVEFHARISGCSRRDWERADLRGGDIRKLVKEKFSGIWCTALKRRSSLELYRTYKINRGHVDRLYDNSRGSGLFASARAGMLNTQLHRRHYAEVDVKCRLCGAEVESIEHLVLHCTSLGGRQDISLDVALGFSLPRCFKEISKTKERLSEWDALTRQ